MPTILTGPRIARSTIAVAAVSTTETDEIDFDLASNQAIEILGFKHIVAQLDETPTTSIVRGEAQHSLHSETTNLEDPSLDADNTVRDSEILDAGVDFAASGDDSGSAQGGITHSRESEQGRWEFFPEDSRPVSVVNLTHRAETDGVITAYASTYMVMYRYVSLSRSELGGFLSLRR